jgi:hypothetical protein
MQSIIMTTAILLGVGGSTAVDVPNGSILVIHNSKKLVRLSTASTITHVAMVFNETGKPYVYEATPAKVRRLELKQYYKEIGVLNRDRKEQMRIEICGPRRAYTDRERSQMLAYLQSQLGRRYSIRGYVRESPGDGIHCAALVGTAVTRSGACRVVNPNRQSPAALMIGLRMLYKPGSKVSIPVAAHKPTMGERWSGMWSGIKLWCSWSLVESFRFCF